MEIYLVYTEKGYCECYLQNGIYRCLHSEDYEKFYGADILSVELKCEDQS